MKSLALLTAFGLGIGVSNALAAESAGDARLASSERSAAQSSSEEKPGPQIAAVPGVGRNSLKSTQASESNNILGGAPGTGTTTASLPTALQAVKKFPLKFSFWSRTSVGRDSIADSNTAKNNATSINAAGFSYLLSETRSIQLRQEWNYTYPTSIGGGSAKLRDAYVGYTDTSLGHFAGDGTISGIFRLYAPTGEDSRFLTKQQGTALGWIIAHKDIGKWEFEFHSINLYFNQSQDYYTSINADGTTKYNANPDYEIEPWFGTAYNVNSKLVLYNTIGTDNVWYHGIPVDGVQRTHAMELDTGVTFKASANIALSASLYDYAAFFNAERPFKVYADKDTFYRLTVVASL